MERKRLRGDCAEGQFFLLSRSRNSGSFATFDEISNSLAIALGVAKKLNAELIVFVPAHDGDLDGERRLGFGSFDVQRQVAP